MCQICRETAFLNNKQRGVLQLKQGEIELVINDERFHPRLHIKKSQTLLLNLLKSDTFITSSGYSFFFFFSQKQFYLLSLPAKAEPSQTETEDPLKLITPTHTHTRANNLFKYFDFAASNCIFQSIHDDRWFLWNQFLELTESWKGVY